MVRADVAEKKIARASAWLDSAAAAYARPVEELRADEPARDLAAFHLFLAIQEAIDLAAHWVADAGWTPPGDLGGTFDVLAAHGAIETSRRRELRGTNVVERAGGSQPCRSSARGECCSTTFR